MGARIFDKAWDGTYHLKDNKKYTMQKVLELAQHQRKKHKYQDVEKEASDKKDAKVAKVMGEFKDGDLKSGGDGKTVTDKDQAIAIALSEAEDVEKEAAYNWKYPLIGAALGFGSTSKYASKKGES